MSLDLSIPVLSLLSGFKNSWFLLVSLVIALVLSAFVLIVLGYLLSGVDIAPEWCFCPDLFVLFWGSWPAFCFFCLSLSLSVHSFA